MKKITSNFIILLTVGLAIGLVGCKKTDDTLYTPTPTVFKYQGIRDFFYKNHTKPQILYVDGTTGGTITGASGIKVTFPPNAFVYKPFNDPVKGLVKIQLTEITEKSEMVYNNIFTMTNADPLVSGGMTHIKAYSMLNGLEVKLAAGVTYQTEFPFTGTPITGMDVFIEDKTDNTPATTWVQNPDTPAIVQVGSNSYLSLNDSLDWQNCDAFMANLGITSFTTINVNVPSAPILLDSCVAFVSFKGQKSVWGLSLISGKFYSNHVCAVPADVVIIGCNGKNLYGGIKRDVILTDGLELDVPIYQMYENQVQNMVSSLN